MRDEPDAGRLKWAQGNVGEEFCHSRRGEVDSCAVVRCGLVAQVADTLLLEEFITPKLESTLKEVSSSSGTEASHQRTGTFICDDLTESANHALVVDLGFELYACLDANDQRSAGCFFSRA